MKKYTFEELRQNPVIKKLGKANNITKEIIEDNEIILSRFMNEYLECSEGPLTECKQMIPGIKTGLNYENGNFYLTSGYCEHWKYEHSNHKQKENIIYASYNLDDMTLDLKDYVKNNPDMDNSRKNFIKYCKNFKEDIKGKGIYLYGESGIGKTYMMKLAANTFAKMDYKVMFLTVNELIKEVKESFNSNDDFRYNKLLNQCFDVDVLILDDIGGEVISPWSRDELLFGLLNYRMENKKLTFLTSNFSIEQLKKNYTKDKFGDKDDKELEKIKSNRFIERIKGLTSEQLLTGKNQRY